MWEVLENNLPAVLKGRSGWKNNKFNSFKEAEQYAKQWCGNLLIDRQDSNRPARVITQLDWADGINITYNEYTCVIKILEVYNIDNRFIDICPSSIESGNEPDLLSIIVEWHLSHEIRSLDSVKYAKQYIKNWCELERKSSQTKS